MSAAATFCVIRCIHGEIGRRAAAWAAHIDQCGQADRFRMVDRAAGDLLLWIMLANELGWSGSDLPVITIGQPLARRLRAENLDLYPAAPEHWQAIEKSVRDTFAKAAEHFDQSPAMTRKIRELATIRDAVQARAARRSHPIEKREAA